MLSIRWPVLVFIALSAAINAKYLALKASLILFDSSRWNYPQNYTQYHTQYHPQSRGRRRKDHYPQESTPGIFVTMERLPFEETERTASSMVTLPHYQVPGENFIEFSDAFLSCQDSSSFHSEASEQPRKAMLALLAIAQADLWRESTLLVRSNQWFLREVDHKQPLNHSHYEHPSKIDALLRDNRSYRFCPLFIEFEVAWDHWCHVADDYEPWDHNEKLLNTSQQHRRLNKFPKYSGKVRIQTRKLPLPRNFLRSSSAANTTSFDIVLPLQNPWYDTTFKRRHAKEVLSSGRPQEPQIHACLAPMHDKPRGGMGLKIKKSSLEKVVMTRAMQWISYMRFIRVDHFYMLSSFARHDKMKNLTKMIEDLPSSEEMARASNIRGREKEQLQQREFFGLVKQMHFEGSITYTLMGKFDNAFSSFYHHQVWAYQRCLYRARDVAHLVAFLDIDEYPRFEDPKTRKPLSFKEWYQIAWKMAQTSVMKTKNPIATVQLGSWKVVPVNIEQTNSSSSSSPSLAKERAKELQDVLAQNFSGPKMLEYLKLCNSTYDPTHPKSTSDPVLTLAKHIHMPSGTRNNAVVCGRNARPCFMKDFLVFHFRELALPIFSEFDSWYRNAASIRHVQEIQDLLGRRIREFSVNKTYAINWPTMADTALAQTGVNTTRNLQSQIG